MSRPSGLPLLLLLLILLSFGCTSSDGGLRAGFESAQYRIIVAFGDSIVEGFRQAEGWPEILGRDLSARYDGIRVINAGVSGDTAADGLARLGRDVLDRDPDMVLISFGLNDMKNGRSVDAFASDLESLVNGIAENGARPVLLTTTRLQRGTGVLARINPEPFNEAINRIASEKAVSLIDVYDGFRGYNTPKYLMDVAHPNTEGYRVLADIIREGLLGE
jgi:acyl-CoA thioesterase-1